MYRKITVAIVLVAGMMLSFNGSALAQSKSSASNRVQTYIDTKMKTDPLLINAIVGILAVDEKGNEIASWNPDMPLLTASTMKTITTGLGYKVLGPDYRFSTKVAYDGKIDASGVLQGDLYIVGGADPTLGSRDTIAFPVDSIFSIWAQAVKDAGIRRINGRIIGDDRIFEEENIPDGWSYGNIGYDYGSGTSGLSFAENLSYFKVAPGYCEGDMVKIEPLGPQSPDIVYDLYDTYTGTPKSGDRTAYYASSMAKIGKFVGSYAIDRGVDTVAFSNKWGPVTCAYEFSRYLAACGVSSRGCTEVNDLDTQAIPDQDALTVVAETFSPELRRIIKVTNTISNNFFAETIYKMVGKTLIERETGEKALRVSYSQANRAICKYLESEGVSTYGYTQDDGSGLSRQNYISPRFFCNFYKMMSESANFAGYFESFPGPGRPGTLKNVLSKETPGVKAAIHAKSGSLSSVRCYAGYVETNKGKLIRFAILTNNYACPTSQVQPKIEGFMGELSRYAGNK
jgi:D-alanyl-D-alanine carboxypeptidase, serine-type, PBP4 family